MTKVPLNLEESIQTPNFFLEPIVSAHAALLFESLQSAELYTYIPFDPPKSLCELEGRYQRWSARQSSDSQELWLNYAIYNAKAEEYVGTLQTTIEANGKTYIAYEVFPCYWRRGIAREALSVLVGYLFGNYPIEAIHAHVDTRNEASFKLLEALNFHRTATIKDADYFKDSSSDEYVYELTKTLGQDK
jgi:[ribosomal protein S5]-alanine N-acetyltransferase